MSEYAGKVVETTFPAIAIAVGIPMGNPHIDSVERNGAGIFRRGITEWENEITINAGRRNLTKQPNEIAPRQNNFRCLSITIYTLKGEP